MNENILTFLRTNDLSTQDAEGIISGNDILINDKQFKVDYIMHKKTQEEVFSIIDKYVINESIQGYNCSLFAYGQTGSGKTYTIQGDDNAPGLVPRTLGRLHSIYPFLKLSFIEIYNENLSDLSNDRNVLNIRDDGEQGVLIDNLNIATTLSYEDSINFYKNGILNRKTSSTSMNDQSSRSHSIFTIYLERSDGSVIKKSKLCFVDLAGSEKLKDIYNNSFKINDSESDLSASNNKFRETTNINKSLLCLGKIVHKLGTNDKWHISYRDSRLTFLLKDSLGGNCKLAIIGNVNLDYSADSISTLQFLNRTKLITNNPTINYEMFDQNIKKILHSLEVENKLLRNQLSGEKRSESIEYRINKARDNLSSIKDEVENIKNSISALADAFYEKNNILQEIDKKVSEINSERKKGIRIILKDFRKK